MAISHILQHANMPMNLGRKNMDELHIYSARLQPATKYIDDVTEHMFVFKNNPRRQMICHKCLRRRWAKNLVVQVYYDGTYVWCKDKENCKREKR